MNIEMETLGSILETGNIILFLIVFMALVLIPMRRQRREIRKLTEQLETLNSIVERLELEKDVYNPGNHSDLTSESNIVGVNQKHIQ